MSRITNKTDVEIIHQDLVDKALNNMPDENMFLNLADTFKLIGDNTRCKILYILNEHEMCVGDIANILDMTKSSISHQLAVLRRSGIVRCRKDGKEVLYKLDDEHISKLYEVASEHILHRESIGDE